MAHESFEDADVAQSLNENFICVKVDREERPDIDSVYMTVCQAVTGSGGWPLSIIMTPDQKPFYAGTYLPKHSRYGSVGLLELSAAIQRQWRENRKSLLESGDRIVEFLRDQTRQTQQSHKNPSDSYIQDALHLFQKNYDHMWGGFSQAPKFPTPHNLLFLMEYAEAAMTDGKSSRNHHAADSSLKVAPWDAMQMAEHTLLQMYKGGIFDHIGGGFSRYSTDSKWLVPHFEKMLYDNALLASAYLKAYQLTKKDLYKTVAKRTLDYVLVELTHEEGGFYCGQDADSDGIEGKYYVFEPQEIKEILGQPDGSWFCEHFDITEKGNFEGSSIPNLIHDSKDNPVLEPLRQKIYDYRLHRTRLHKDDKILTSWNGLMIAAFAEAGALLKEPRYVHAAKSAERFITNHLLDRNDQLKVRWRDGQAAHKGLLDDYAFFGYALLRLYETTLDLSYLQKSERMADQILAQFSHEDSAGFFLYSKDSEQLISRPKEVYDGALPSGNSVAALLLIKLARLTGKKKWLEAENRQLAFIEKSIAHYPAGYSFSLLALLSAMTPSRELVCSLSDEVAPQDVGKEITELKTATYNLSVLIKTRKNECLLSELAPFTESYPIPDMGMRFYLCKNGACAAPVERLQQLRSML